ncbi:MAG: hypothetical protein GY705_20080 [Bacteroidetes bacterium]|nr:hypothetical protein [Bacteroidota bacterium]
MSTEIIIIVLMLVVFLLLTIVTIRVLNHRKILRIRKDINLGLPEAYDELTKMGKNAPIDMLVEILKSQSSTLRNKGLASMTLSNIGHAPAIQLIMHIIRVNILTFDLMLDAFDKGPYLRVLGYEANNGLLNSHNKAEASIFISAVTSLAKQHQDKKVLSEIEHYYILECKRVMGDAWNKRREEQSKAGY